MPIPQIESLVFNPGFSTGSSVPGVTKNGMGLIDVYAAYLSLGDPDTTAPTPNPMTWSSEPAEDSTSQISMTATTASDVSTPVRYYFDETSGNPGGDDSSWQTSTSYSDSGLSENTQYTLRWRGFYHANQRCRLSSRSNE